MVVYITMKERGIKNVKKMLMKLPKVLLDEVDKTLETFSKAVVTSARRRAPHDMGFLASQINMRKTAKCHFVIDTGDAYYALAIEKGFRPHVIPNIYIEQHYSSPATPGVYTNPLPDEIKGFITVGRGPRPFMKPAFESELMKLRTKWSRVLKNAINKARR